MRIGISFDLKDDLPDDDTFAGDSQGNVSSSGGHLPDDLHEEFDSPVTVEAIASVLRDLGHEVIQLGDGRELMEHLLADPPDFVFNFAEGQGVGRAREARVPAVLEMLGIPYTGSDPLTLAATLDKDVAKRLVSTAGVAVPRGVVISPEQIENYKLKIANCKSDRDAIFNSQFSISNFQFPLVVKPAWEGSSKGIREKCLVRTPRELMEVVDDLAHDYRQPILVEEYIQGDEVTVGILGNDPPQVLGIMRVVPTVATDAFIYSLEVKRDFRRLVRYECPAPLPAAVTAAITKAALVSYNVLGCRDVARVDFRVCDGIPYFLEVNPLPGLNPESSDLVLMANLVGWSHARLVETILESALRRQSKTDGVTV